MLVSIKFYQLAGFTAALIQLCFVLKNHNELPQFTYTCYVSLIVCHAITLPTSYYIIYYNFELPVNQTPKEAGYNITNLLGCLDTITYPTLFRYHTHTHTQIQNTRQVGTIDDSVI